MATRYMMLTVRVNEDEKRALKAIATKKGYNNVSELIHALASTQTEEQQQEPAKEG